MHAFVSAKHRYRMLLFVAQGGCCIWCGGEMTFRRLKNGAPARDFATFEHLERRRDGGRDSSGNLVLAHRKCNRKREHGIKTHAAGRPDGDAGACSTGVEQLA